MPKGYVSLVLHSHLPYVRHPEADDALEERWLFEAINECYLPLIDVYDRLIDDKVNFKITMSITPPLMSMLEDEYLNERYLEFLKKSIELSEKELKRTENDEGLNKIAKFYNNRFNGLLETYDKYDRRIMTAFKKFVKLGVLEVLTCSATHALLPLLTINPEAVKAQLHTGIESFKEHMGFEPNGIWLPECAYTYGIDEILKELGIKYFISESKAVTNASPRPIYGTAAPIVMQTGVSAFGRDVESSHQVWSSFMGYPGDVDYREFYKDIGYELPVEYIGEYINKSGVRIDTGIKYYRITGNTDHKQIYNRGNALKKVESHADHFANSRNTQIESLSEHMEVPPLITCPYDTELYGHWWFEGPDFIESFIRKSCEEWTNYELTTPSEYLAKYPQVQCATPSPSSWGEGSDYSVWLNPSNDWIYRDLHQCAESMIRLANTYNTPTELQKRALNQAARELMLAESSDWAFIIKGNTTVNYAKRRVNLHVERFQSLYDVITKNCIEAKTLSKVEEVDNIFPNMNYKIYAN